MTHRDDDSPIQLARLWWGMPGLGEVWGRLLATAAMVVLQQQKHHSGVFLNVEGACSRTLNLEWSRVPETDYPQWEPLEATEYGACGIAIAVERRLTEQVVIRRSELGEGCDYWLGPPGMVASEDFQGLTPLEVSGIRSGGRGKIRRRVREKVSQVKKRRTESGVVVVVEFSRLICHVEKV